MSGHDDGLRAVFARHRRLIALTVALLALTLLAGTALLGLAGHFLTAAALAGTAAVGFNFFAPSAGIRGLTFVRILSRYGEKLAGHDATLRIARDLRVWFFARALPLAPLGLGRHRIGDLLSRLVADIETVDGLLVRAWGPLAALALLVAIGLVVALCVLPAAGLLLLIAVAAMALATLLPSRRGDALERARTQSRAALRHALQEAIEGAADLQALHATDGALARIDAQAVALASHERRRRRRLATPLLLQQLIGAGTLPALLWVLAQALATQRIGAPAAGGLLFLTVALLEAMAGMAPAWLSWQAARASLQRLRDIAGQPPAASAPSQPQTLPARGELHVDRIVLRWPEQLRAVLDGLDLRIAPGERVALGGDSGAGKSSLLALALRLRDPDGGRVTWGGVDLRMATPADWHARIAWLPQDAPVFAGSVRDNLRMGDAHADDARLWEVLAQVRLAERFGQGGLDEWIGEGGSSLSAGQARRLALARALLRDAPLLLLDEPTEGLDEDTAHALLADLVAALSDRSLLMITHDQLPPGIVHRHYRLIDGRLADG